MSDDMTAISADELLGRADVCAFRDTARELLRADADPLPFQIGGFRPEGEVYRCRVAGGPDLLRNSSLERQAR